MSVGRSGSINTETRGELMSDKAAKLLAGSIFTLAIAYLITHIHTGFAVPRADAFGYFVIFNTITGEACVSSPGNTCITENR